MIRTVPIATLRIGDILPVQCAGEVRFAVGDDGRQWVAKRSSGGDIVAESCAWLLAQEVAVPVVDDVRVASDENGLWWLGSYAANAQHFAASHAATQADALGALFALDALLGNEDRHARNILVAQRSARTSIVAIDFAGSWCSRPTSFLERGLEVPRLDALAEGFSRPLIEGSARACATRIEGIRASVLASIAAEACDLASYGRAADLEEALLTRASSIHVILDKLLASLA